MRSCAKLIALAGVAALGWGTGAEARGAVVAGKVGFNRDIRPIFAANCYECHGPDGERRRAGLELDRRAGLFSKLKGVYPVVPGHPERSEIYRRITSADPEVRMPKKGSGKRLTSEQIGLIKRWIAEGAPWEEFWAWVPPVRPRLPEVREGGWARNPIDRFVMARLEQAGLSHSAAADRRTLIRRVSFDLTGLPPAPAAVRAFLGDRSPGAYERVVDRLLASPHYGERMAVWWLDEVRYADTDGYHADNYRSVYPYRDYVIGAFNGDMPFDRFTVEQLAGDLLPHATMAQRVASTYNRLGRSTEEGGAQPKEYLAKYMADRVRTTSEAWLGITLGCTECHDHKFDPFTTKDFYSLEAFFADVKEAGVGKRVGSLVTNVEQGAVLAGMEGEMARWQRVLDTPTPALAEAQAGWEEQVLHQRPLELSVWRAVGPFGAAGFGAAFKTAFAPEKGVDLTKSYRGGRLRWREHAEWADGKAHTGIKGENAATYLYRTITAPAARRVTLRLGSDDGIKVWLNGKQVLAHKVTRAVAPDQEKVPVELQAGENRLLVKIVNGRGDCGFYFQADDRPPGPVMAILETAPALRTGKQLTKLAKYYRAIAPELDGARGALAKARERRDRYAATLPTTLASVAVKPRVIRVLPRGNWMIDTGQIVSPAVPRFLDFMGDPGGRRLGRLDLARWIVSRKNPLTARVFVNRLWKLYFGTGISKTLDDFGSRGEWPTDPGLLDWLAVEFMDSGWDIKHMVKLMVMSATYRQTAVPTKVLEQRDPFNRLYARQSPIRLDAEAIRDNALSVAGMLTERIGGPSVKPYQPAGYWAQLNFPKRTYVDDHGAAEYRRGLYTFWCRTFLNPSLEAFDAPSREECTIERTPSNTPLQALVLLNDPTYVEAARVFAEALVREAMGNVAQGIDWAYERALDRGPKPEEARVLGDLYARRLADYRDHPAAAREVALAGEWPVARDLDPSRVAAWTAVARVILNLHETITRF